MDPKISVVMTAFNSEKYIKESIEGVLNQTFTMFEFIIVDDGSTDDTVKIISEFKDDRIKLIQRENGGPAAAANTGLAASKCEYVARIDSDDICYPNRFQLQYEFLNNNKDFVIIGGGVIFIEDNGLLICEAPLITNPEELHEKLDDYSPIAHSSVMMRKSIALECGGYDELLWGYFDDQLLWSKMRHLGKIGNLSAPVIKYRFRPTATTTKNNSEEFSSLKSKIIFQGFANEEDAGKVASLSTETRSQKEYSYYLLLAKKYCFNNFQFWKLQKNVINALIRNPLSVDAYLLCLLGFAPKKVVEILYNRTK